MQINSLGSSNNTEPEKSNLKKYILIALIASVVLLIIVLICIVLFSSMQPKVLTVSIDGNLVDMQNKLSQDTFIIDENNNVYVSLSDIANEIGYRYYRGVYGSTQQYTEDNSKCYLQCDDEVVMYELTSDKIYKTPIDENTQYSEFDIAQPVKRSNNKLYVISSALAKGCNLSFSYNPTTNQILISTLPALYKQYNDKATAGEYANVDEISDNFNNKKAILYGMLVVKSGTKYGVISLDGSQTYIGTKYDDMEFIEDAQEFLVNANQKYGIITKDGTIKIGLDYSKIELLDNLNSIYYVENSQGKKGVLNRTGKILGKLYVEYDEIGINTLLFPVNDIKNSRLLYDNCIPVKKDGKWAMFDVTGNIISNFNWDNFGYIHSTSNSERSQNILLIEYISGIVVSKNGKYGIINSVGDLLVPCVFDKIYSETLGGEQTYYIQFEGSTIDLDTYLKEEGIEIENPNDDDGNGGMIDLNATPTPNLDLETPNIIQESPSPSPTPVPTATPEQIDLPQAGLDEQIENTESNIE